MLGNSFPSAQIGAASLERPSSIPIHGHPIIQPESQPAGSAHHHQQGAERGKLLTEFACSVCPQTGLTILTGRQCSYCTTDEDFYCIICDVENCKTRFCARHETCWDKHLPQAIRVAQKHVPIDPLPQLFVEAVTYKETDPDKQKRMHQRDELARWFNIRRDNLLAGRPDLYVYDRFTQLCDPNLSGNQETRRHYPSFVSFVGDTSVGKSTLVRAMLLMGIINPSLLVAAPPSTDAEGGRGDASGEEEDVPNDQSLVDFVAAMGKRSDDGPVTKSGYLNDLTYPTTCGVHLYRDEGIREHSASSGRLSSNPSSSSTAQYPILLADCEGFNTESKTNAERMEESSSDNVLDPTSRGRNAPADDPRHRSPSRHRETALVYPVRANCYSGRGKDGIDLFYARFLYAVSDVIVFVSKEDAKIQSEITRVLEWASKAVHKSVNHPSRKTLIIVRNMSNDLHDPQLYDSNVLKKLYLHNVDYPRLWDESPILRDFVKEYNGRPDRPFVERITSNGRLYKALFNNITCCYVPHRGKVKGKPQELFLQYRRLRDTIESSVREGMQLRAESVMQYNVPALTHILGRAFDHFTTSEDPFDFYLAARKDNPNPQSIRDHVANFLRHVLEKGADADRKEGDAVDYMAKDFISVALLVFTHRNFTEGN